MLFSSSNSFTWVDFLSYLPFVNYMTKGTQYFMSPLYINFFILYLILPHTIVNTVTC